MKQRCHRDDPGVFDLAWIDDGNLEALQHGDPFNRKM
jgi:hypothetical protein